MSKKCQSCQKIVKKLSKSCQKMSESCQNCKKKIVEKFVATSKIQYKVNRRDKNNNNNNNKKKIIGII
jgi:hypothetical protein